MYFTTSNKNKFREARSILGNNIELKQLDIDLPEIQSLDSKEIIKFKLIEAGKHTNEEIVVEDQSLDVATLNGLPGPFIKYFLKALGVNGFSGLVRKYRNRNVIAKTIIGYLDKTKRVHYFEGSVTGKIVEPRGDKGFGWDPIFEENKSKLTFGEMPEAEKNKVSMRKIAFEKLRKFVVNQS